ncbi:hypothetical protein [Bradyrhizobium sp. NBAIM01]|uniref:hypothetical protein n=1 Tax=Bradyrhizobium sp. NBAIM01 TaxID=2793818 RepID=UPI001CD44FAE|nr:hypothetical protein [Bradyrhizobium sp. NBAIM01]MCA1510284.1 hypothetical protein [Bradyrhizobium sp. NBAIM01]
MFIRHQPTVSFDLPSARGEDEHVSTNLTERQHVKAIVLEPKRKAFGRRIVLFSRGNSGRTAHDGSDTIGFAFGQQLPA